MAQWNKIWQLFLAGVGGKALDVWSSWLKLKMSRWTIWSGSILLTWRLNAAVWTSGVAMVGKWGRFSSQRWSSATNKVWMALGLAKHWQILIYQTFWVCSGNLIVVTGKLIVWRQSIAVDFSMAKPPGSQHLRQFSFHTKYFAPVFVQLILNFIIWLLIAWATFFHFFKVIVKLPLCIRVDKKKKKVFFCYFELVLPDSRMIF